MSTNEELVTQLIKSHYRTIRYLLATALGVFILGMLVIVASFFSGDVANLPSAWIKVAGGVISSLGALPVKEILEHQNKAERAKIIQDNYKAINMSPRSVSKEERQRVLELMTKLADNDL